MYPGKEVSYSSWNAAFRDKKHREIYFSGPLCFVVPATWVRISIGMGIIRGEANPGKNVGSLQTVPALNDNQHDDYPINP